MAANLGEGLMAPGLIRLFGREFAGLALPAEAGATPDAAQAPRLARIYGYSYLGSFTRLGSPTVLRVFGPGTAVLPGADAANAMDVLGMALTDVTFADGLLMWSADHLDVAVRIDVTVGEFRDVLLEPDAGHGARSDVVGRDSGLVGRDSGLVGRDSGLVGRDSGFVGRARR